MANFSSSLINAANGQASQPGCTECTDSPDIEAVILYPSLGTPLVLGPNQKTCSIFIATNSAGKTAFCLHPDTRVPTALHIAVDRHLRLNGIDSKLKATDTKQGTLFSDGKGYGAAKAAIKGRWLGRFANGQVHQDINKTFFFTVSPHAARLYGGMSELFEIILDLKAAPFAKINSASFQSFSWMVKLNDSDKKEFGLGIGSGVSHMHCNDIFIRRFLSAQAGTQNHYPSFFEFDLGHASNLESRLPPPKAQHDSRLWNWHPVIRAKSSGNLKLGHLSDVHVNVRQNTLARSPACVIEGKAEAGSPGEPVGKRLNHCLVALNDLVGQYAGKADALFITGDLIDFNRNLDPGAVGKDIGSQWKAFNVLTNILDGKLYQRGMDDMLVYSLVRHAYLDLKLPVFLTSGNHEAYQVPYGISPRLRAKDVLHGAGEEPGSFVDQVKDLSSADIEKRSRYAAWKANEGIAADHNLTIYEAILAYGPTYAQVVTSENFNQTQFDWFHALFTPLDNWCIPFGDTPAKPAQVLLGLGWGEAENYKNTDGLVPLGSDKQGAGILPRSVGGISGAQQEIIAGAQRVKAAGAKSLSAFSHFTLVNFAPEVAFAPGGAARSLRFTGDKGAAFNSFNAGTCEQGQKLYFSRCINQSANGVDFHFSGHSHRAGVYRVKVGQEVYQSSPRTAPIKTTVAQIEAADDPGLSPDGVTAPADRTALIVSSSGGPVGIQNVNGELAGWTLRPPSGTLLDPASRRITQIKSGLGAKPRLCVALDYLHIEDHTPLRWHAPVAASQTGGFPADCILILGSHPADLDCIASIRFWVFEGGEVKTPTGKQQLKEWRPIKTTLAAGKSPRQRRMRFDTTDLATLNRLIALNRGRMVTKAFCEVSLKAPAHAWANDMDCTDPWVFPVEIGFEAAPMGAYAPMLRRPFGELGEVPEWKWLNKTFPEKYPSEREVVYSEPKSVAK